MIPAKFWKLHNTKIQMASDRGPKNHMTSAAARVFFQLDVEYYTSLFVIRSTTFSDIRIIGFLVYYIECIIHFQLLKNVFLIQILLILS